MEVNVGRRLKSVRINHQRGILLDRASIFFLYRRQTGRGNARRITHELRIEKEQRIHTITIRSDHGGNSLIALRARGEK